MNQDKFYTQIEKMTVRDIQDTLGISKLTAMQLKHGNSICVDVKKLLQFLSNLQREG